MVICEGCGKEFRLAVKDSRRLCRACKRTNSIVAKWGTIEAFEASRLEKTKQTHIQNHGVEWPQSLEIVKEKVERTNLERYGTKCSAKNPEVLQKIEETNLARYGVKSSNSADIVKAKKAEVWGASSPFAKPETVEKTKAVKEARYGDPAFNNRLKSEETCLAKYGVANAANAESTRLKFAETWAQKTDDEKEAIDGKRRATNLERFGVERFQKSYKYLYEGEWFDSSWEVYYYIYLTMRGFPFILKPSPALQYLDSRGKTHYYFPDFLVGGVYHEVKGGNLLKDGKLYDYGNKIFLVEKQKCLEDNNVKLITLEEMKPIIKEVNAKMGRGFVTQYRQKRNKPNGK